MEDKKNRFYQKYIEPQIIPVYLIIITLLLFGIGITAGKIHSTNQRIEECIATQNRKIEPNERFVLVVCGTLDFLQELTAKEEQEMSVQIP